MLRICRELYLQVEVRCSGFDLRIVLFFVERGELVNRIGVQPLGFDTSIALGVGVVGMPVCRIVSIIILSAYSSSR